MNPEWWVAIVLGSAFLIGAIGIWLGRRDPSIAPYDPGVGRTPGGLYELGRKLREKEAKEENRDKGH